MTNGGMQTRITVIDGMDGHTPDMLRKRKQTGAERYFAERQVSSQEYREEYEKARQFTQYYRDPMHD